MVRAFNEDGMIDEVNLLYYNLDAVLRDLDQGIKVPLIQIADMGAI